MKSAIKKQAQYISLDNFISGRFLTDKGWTNIDAKLDDSDVEQIMAIVGNRCQDRTKVRIMDALLNVKAIDGDSLMKRVQYHPAHGWEYVAGQSYPDEIRALRKSMIKNF